MVLYSTRSWWPAHADCPPRYGPCRSVVAAAGARGSRVVRHCVGVFWVGRRQPGASGAGQGGGGLTLRHRACRPVVPEAGARGSHVVRDCVGASCAGRRRPGAAGAGQVGGGRKSRHRACLRWCRRPAHAVLTLYGIASELLASDVVSLVGLVPVRLVLARLVLARLVLARLVLGRHRGMAPACRRYRRPVLAVLTLHGIAFELLALNAVGPMELVPPRLVTVIAAQGVSAGGAGVRCARFSRCMALRRRDLAPQPCPTGGEGVATSRCMALRSSFSRQTRSAGWSWCRPGWCRRSRHRACLPEVPASDAGGSHVAWHCGGGTPHPNPLP
jgi:hypothetical protein